MKSKPEDGSLEERISRQVQTMEEEEKRMFLLLLERGDLGVLTKERRTRRVLFASKDGKIKVTNQGVVGNKAAKAADQYLESIGGMAKLIQWLEVVEAEPKCPGHVKNVLAMARISPHKRLSRIIAECGSSQPQVSKWVLEGARMTGEREALTILHQAQPKAMKELVKRVEDGNHPEFLESLEAYMAATKMVQTGKGDVNVAVGVNVQGQGSDSQRFFETNMKAMEKIIEEADSKALPEGKPIEAEIVGVKEKEKVV